MDLQLLDAVKKARGGDKSAIEYIYVNTSKTVYYTALGITKNAADAEDITEDVFIKAFNKLPELKNDLKFMSWLKMIAVNESKNYCLKKKPYLFSDDEDGNNPLDSIPEPSDELIPDKRLDRLEKSRMISEMISSLPEKQRIVVTLFYFDGLSVAKIAQILETNENTVKSRLKYARADIKEKVEQLEKKGIKLYAFPFFPMLGRILGKSARQTEVPPSVMQGVLSKLAAETAGTSVSAAPVAGIPFLHGSAKIIGAVGLAAIVIVFGAVYMQDRTDDPIPVYLTDATLESESESERESEGISSDPELSTADSSASEPVTFAPEPDDITGENTDNTTVGTGEETAVSSLTDGTATPSPEVSVPPVTEEPVPVSYTNEELENEVRKMMDDPTYTPDQSYLDSINYIRIYGAELVAVNRQIFDVVSNFSSNLDTKDDVFRYTTLDGENVTGSYGTITSLDFLKKCKNINSVLVAYNKITDISALSALPMLINIDLNHNQISDISPLATLANGKNIAYVNLIANNITDLSPLAGLTGADTLELSLNDFSDISPLAGLTKLGYLSFDNCNVSDISPLSGLTGLTQLSFGANKVSDITPLANLTSMINLHFIQNQVSDLSPLKNLTEVERLSFSYCPVSDISVLAGMSKLVSVQLFSTSVTDISVLLDKKIEWLEISNGKISQSQLNEFTALHPDCIIHAF